MYSSAISCGSSPLARGTLVSQPSFRGRHRFIPAGAGNTRTCAPGRPSAAVHPRWRGEHAAAVWFAIWGAGSSPLARGTPHSLPGGFMTRRFIPAGAGNTAKRVMNRSATPVHPRWRGEHAWAGCVLRMAIGSSPLARGTPIQGRPQRRLRRFIPAGAGNTKVRHESLPQQLVHPRWRGEHTASRSRSCSVAGSSPLARGTPLAAEHINRRRRFIPAGAGNTLSLTNCSQRRKSAAKNLPTSPC